MSGILSSRPEKFWRAIKAADPQSKDRMLGHVDKVIPSLQESPHSPNGHSRTLQWGDSAEKQAEKQKSPIGWGELTTSVEPAGPRPPRSMFVDAAAMKEKVRRNIASNAQYDVTDFYYTSGCPQRIARSTYFDYTTLFVITLNALWIAIETDHNDSEALLDADIGFILVENVFCAYFFAEWLLRFLAFERKLNGFRDAWFVFDSILVFTMVMETWVMAFIVKFTSSSLGAGMGNASILRMARLLRLSRMARMVRLLRAVPELMILVKGMVAAMRSVAFTLLLLLFFIYVFAIFFTQLASDNQVLSVYFHGVGQAMYTLAMHGVFLEDLIVIMDIMKEESIFLATVFFLFVMIAALTLMNMLIGVLCEVVTAVSSTEKEALEVAFVKAKLQQVLMTSFPGKAGQEAHELSITKEEYEQILENPSAARLLQEVGVDVVGLVDLTDLFFEDNDDDETSDSGRQTLSFGDMMESVLELRGTNNATVKDVMNLRKFIRVAIDSRMDKIEKTFLGRRLSSGHRRSSDASTFSETAVVNRKDAEGGRCTPLATTTSIPGMIEQVSVPPGYPKSADPPQPQVCPVQLLQNLQTRVDSMDLSMKSRMDSLEMSMALILERLPPG